MKRVLYTTYVEAEEKEESEITVKEHKTDYVVTAVNTDTVKYYGALLPKEYMNALLDSHSMILGVLDEEKKPASVMLCKLETCDDKSNWKIEIKWIFTAAKKRGNGYGAALLNHLTDTAKAYGASEIFIKINENMPGTDRIIDFVSIYGFDINEDCAIKVLS